MQGTINILQKIVTVLIFAMFALIGLALVCIALGCAYAVFTVTPDYISGWWSAPLMLAELVLLYVVARWLMRGLFMVWNFVDRVFDAMFAGAPGENGHAPPA